jgi:hypothetical protein
MKQKLNLAVLGLAVAGFSPLAQAVNDAPADADTVTLRMSCTEGGAEISNCFETMAAVDNWLKTVRLSGSTRPTLINIGPGKFNGSWACTSSNVTLRGSGRDRSVLTDSGTPAPAAVTIGDGCTNLDVQDITIDGSSSQRGVYVFNLTAVTSWTNVEIKAPVYGWVELQTGTCPSKRGKHLWFSSRIRATGSVTIQNAKAYVAHCAQSWFWGSEISSEGRIPSDIEASQAAFAIDASDAEIHLYGSNVRLVLADGTSAREPTVGVAGIADGHFLIAALQGSEVHIHGTGLDVIHNGTGTADMLYADSTSHFHANASGFNIHVSGTGKVQRLAGDGRIEAPYTWGESTVAPLSTTADGTPTLHGVGTLLSRNGADRYTETDCQPNGNCSSGGGFPHDMVYLATCTGSAASQGPWFDMTTKACRQ